MDADLKIVRPSFDVSNTDASFDVSITDATYDVSYVKATYELASTTATFDVSSLAASFVVSYTNITPTVIELGIFLLRHDAVDAMFAADFTSLLVNKGVADSALLVDAHNLAIKRSLVDTAVGDDSIAQIATNKDLQDLGYAAELISVSPAKGFISPSDVSDSLDRQVDFDRAFSEAGGATDLEFFGLGTAQSSAATAVESIEFQTAYTRDHADFAAFSAANDILTIVPTKVLSEVVAQAHTVTFDVATNLYDSLTVTDDFDGEAVLDDDQIMTFTKVTVDLGNVSDSFTAQWGYYRNLLDTAVTSDLSDLYNGKVLSELVLQSEQLTFGASLSKQDVANAGDTASVLFATDVSDNGYTSDSDVKLAGINKSELATAADAGLLYGQDYVDNLFYFAEDYVGFSRIF